MKILTYTQLEQLNTGRLVALLKSVRVRERIAGKSMVCDCCGEFLGDQEAFQKEFDEKVKPITDYTDNIKNILSTRENVKKGSKNV